MTGAELASSAPPLARLTPLRRWWTRPAAPLLVVAGAMLAIHLVTNGLYGFHTDELYYILCGQHPALGYVDFPPVTPMLALVDTSIFGIHPWTLRLFPAITGAAVVFLAGLFAREMGGSRGTSILAAVVVSLTPLALGTWLFQTVEFDLLTWTIAIYLLLRMLRTGDPRLFIYLGVDLGVGLETKTTILALCTAIAIAVVLSPELRPFLRTRYPWIGVILAAALWAPNVAWQFANGFPTLVYIRNHGSDIAQGGGIVTFVEFFVLTIGPLFLPIWAVGLISLLRDRRMRSMGVLTVVVILVFLPEGKGYYPGPTIPLVLAAGCVAISRVRPQERQRWLTAPLLAAGVIQVVVLLPIILPVIPPPLIHVDGVDKLNPDLANTIGWQDMTAQVGAVYNALPPEERDKAAILASIDGQAAAIDIYGGPQHLPQAISPHLNFWYWKPSNLDATTLVTVGYDPGELEFLCGTITRAGNVTIPYSIDNLNQGAPILVCTNLRESINAAWPSLRNFS